MGATTRRSLVRNLREAGRMIVIICLMAGGAPREIAEARTQDASGAQVRIERGRVLVMSLSTAVDSGSAKIGDRVELRLVDPVMSGGKVALPAGWIVPAHISKVRHAGKKNCHRGYVELKLEPMTAPDGTKIKLLPMRWRPYRDGKPADSVQVRSTGEKLGKAVEGAAIAPIFVAAVVILLPSVVAMAMSEGEPCRGRAGVEEQILAGTIRYAAIAKDVRVSPEPTTAH